MIKIKEKKKKKSKQDPYYLLEFNYMIGDANGNTSEEIEISTDNPFLERFVTLLNSLKPTHGRWGVVLDSNRLKTHLDENQITEDDFHFLNHLMFSIESTHFSVTEDQQDFSYSFCEAIRADTEYSFLVFQGIDLYYYDEFGIKHETEIINETK